MTSDLALQAAESICEHLSDRTATLFLGAGVNAGVVNASGQSLASGADLSARICDKLLDSPDLKMGLDEAAEIARTKVGATALNNLIYDSLTQYEPSTAHYSIVQLPWDNIYTTNYDLLIETAASSGLVKPAGNVKAVCSSNDDVESFHESDILYYKLHGTIDQASTHQGRLILTKDDYRFYEDERRGLFKRLRRDLPQRTFLFLGYSMSDSNFLGLLEDCRKELQRTELPLTYAIRRHFAPLQETYWRDKFNIQLIEADGSEFLTLLKETWFAQNRKVLSFEELRTKKYLQADEAASFEKIGESFYLIEPGRCVGTPQPSRFFHGADPSWADIRAKFAPVRDTYWALLEAIFPEMSEPKVSPSAYLLTGSAGTGKSTLLRTLLYDLSNEFKLTTLGYIPGAPLDANVLSTLVHTSDFKRIIVLIENAGERLGSIEQFLSDLKDRKLPVTVIMEERRNQWKNALRACPRLRLTAEFEVGDLSQSEMISILDALEHNNCLDKLTGTDRTYQLEHFTELAHRDLLIALRELTTLSTFDEIVKDEFEKIPSSLAQRAYTYVSALGRLDLAVRYEVLLHILDLDWHELRDQVFIPTEGILISGEETGTSRHNMSFRLRTRHPILAQIIFQLSAPDDETKFSILNQLLSQLDPGYVEDRRLLDILVRKRELVEVFESDHYKRSIYERLELILPKNQFVLQHRSIFEREQGEANVAIEFAKKALEIDPRNSAIQNTLGLAYEAAARDCGDALKAQYCLREAEKLFDAAIGRDVKDAFGHLGKFYCFKHQIDKETDTHKRQTLKLKALSMLQNALEVTNKSNVIAKPLAKLKEDFGNTDDAIELLQAGVKKDPTDTRLRDFWIGLETERRRFEEALKIAVAGTKYDPTAWRLQRHIARLLRRLKRPTQSIKGHYEGAIRSNSGDIDLLIEFGAWLFESGQKSEAALIFEKAKNLDVPYYEKNQGRHWLTDDNDVRRKYTGTLKRFVGAGALVLSIPDNIEAFMWRSGEELKSLKIGDTVTFEIGFNVFGAYARAPHSKPASSATSVS
jgi:tetratricopeptide (TPR) repeat protein